MAITVEPVHAADHGGEDGRELWRIDGGIEGGAAGQPVVLDVDREHGRDHGRRTARPDQFGTRTPRGLEAGGRENLERRLDFDRVGSETRAVLRRRHRPSRCHEPGQLFAVAHLEAQAQIDVG